MRCVTRRSEKMDAAPESASTAVSLAVAVARSDMGTGSSALLEAMLLSSELELDCCHDASSVGLSRLRDI